MTDPDRSPADLPGAPAADADGPGALLGAERRRQGLSLGDVARQLKLSVRQIEALERDDYAAFAGMVFVRGFLRNYAKLLQVDADALLVGLPGVSAPNPSAAEEAAAAADLEAGRRSARPGFAWIAGAAAVLVLLVVAAIYEGRQHRAPAPAPLAPSPVQGMPVNPQHADSPPPVPGATATTPNPPPGTVDRLRPDAPTDASAGQATVAGPFVSADPSVQQPTLPAAPRTAAVPGEGELRLTFETESWVEVKDGTGAVLLSRLNRPGSEQVVQGQPPLTVVVGNAHGVQIRYEGRTIDLSPHTRVDVARLVLE